MMNPWGWKTWKTWVVRCDQARDAGGRSGKGRGKVEEVCIMGLMSEESVMLMLMYDTVLRVSRSCSFLLIDRGRDPGAGFAALLG